MKIIPWTVDPSIIGPLDLIIVSLGALFWENLARSVPRWRNSICRDIIGWRKWSRLLKNRRCEGRQLGRLLVNEGWPPSGYYKSDGNLVDCEWGDLCHFAQHQLWWVLFGFASDSKALISDETLAHSPVSGASPSANFRRVECFLLKGFGVRVEVLSCF